MNKMNYEYKYIVNAPESKGGVNLNFWSLQGRFTFGFWSLIANFRLKFIAKF